MSVGIAVMGREVTMTVGGQTLLGTITKAFTFANENGDTSDDSTAGWQQFLATPIKKSVSFTLSGLVKNYELVAAYFAGGSEIYEVVVNYPDGSVLTFDAITESVNQTGESNGLTTFDVAYQSSGTPVFVAGT